MISNSNIGTVRFFNDGLVRLAQHIQHLTVFSKDSTRESRLRSFRESFAMMTDSKGGTPEFEELLALAAGAASLYGVPDHPTENMGDGPVVTVQMTMPQHAEQLEDLYRAGQVRDILLELLKRLQDCFERKADFDGFSMRECNTSTGSDSYCLEKRMMAENIHDWVREEAERRGVDLGRKS